MLRTRRLTKLLMLLAFFGLLAFTWTKSQAITDWIKLRGYTPPTAIAALATHDDMTNSARHVYYVNRPELISNKTDFQKACTQTEQTIVLGCYIGVDGGIKIFSVSDKRLNGVEEVTAGHEMLHAAYDRLSKADKQQVDAWLEDYYKHDLKDQRIIDTIKSYQKTEPNDVVNEMHSVFGTEVSKLPAPLENYYKRYFSNRQKVVSYSDKYEAAFTSRENQAKAMYEKLQALSSQIKNIESDLTSQKGELDATRGSINSQAQANAFNRKVDAYNSQVSYLDQLISQYNSLRDQYNNLVVQEQQLLNAIDTRSVKTESTQ